MSSNSSIQQSPTEISREVHQVVDDINLEHSLNIAVDPRHNDRQQASDDRSVLRLLQFLHAHDRKLMQKTIREFNRQAVLLCSGWVFKLQADHDVLPKRDLSPRKRGNVQKANLTVAQSYALKALLLSLLQGAKSEYYRSHSNSQRLPVRPASQNVQRAHLPRMASPTGSTVSGSSIDEDLLNFDLREAEGSSEGQCIEYPGLKKAYNEAPLDMAMPDGDDSFKTPPQSPSEIHRSRRLSTDKARSTVTGKRESPDANYFGGSRKRSMHQADVSSPPPSFRRGVIPTSSDSVTAFADMGISSSKTNTNHSFTTNATSLSFGEWKSSDNTREDSSQKVKVRGIVRSDSDPSKPISTKAEQSTFPCRLPEVSGYLDVRQQSNRDPGKSSLEMRLHDYSPLSFDLDGSPPGLPLRVIYEVTRLALHYKVSAQDLYEHLHTSNQSQLDDYEQVWRMSREYCMKHSDIAPPERSQVAAWQAAGQNYDRVSFKADFKFTNSVRGPIFGLQLQPLALEDSYRLARHFGFDRFLVLSMPALEAKDLPDHLPCNADLAREAIVEWLVNSTHHLLGRQWRAFYVKPKARRPKAAKTDSFRWRVYLFAVDGDGFVQFWSKGPAHKKISLEDMVTWFLPFRNNLDSSALKLFSRLQLAVSTTTPTVEFSPSQIIRCDDTFAGYSAVRHLDTRRHQQKLEGEIEAPDLKVMSDGCARISQAAAKQIALDLGVTDHVPSAFQARIGGAKGVWVVDTIAETLNGDPVWIEIADSQLKFEGSKNDLIRPDKDRVTFEVHARSSPLKPAFLNFQLMPILIDRGLNSSVFSGRLQEDLKEKTEHLKNSMQDSLSLRAWNQENNPVTGSRVEEGSIRQKGGLPDSMAEQINALTESGFDPKSCKFLSDLCYKAATEYCERLEERMHIEIGQSTYALMIPDFMGILEEDEIHLGFSGTFLDPKSGFADTMVDNRDVLVARLPAALPSDIHKVKAVFRRELARLKDVVVFSTKGKFSLAEKLSGGDFDGDRAWVCWDPELVERFVNFDMPHPKLPESYGITKDKTGVGEMYAHKENFFEAWILKGFLFNMRRPLLAICTSYYEGYCYNIFRKWGSGSLADARTIELAQLLGILVDTAKNGYTFTERQWDEYKSRKTLPRNTPKPAFKTKGSTPSNHIIDHLVLKVAKEMRQKTLHEFEKPLKKAWSRDMDLIQVAEEEEIAAREDNDIGTALSWLKSELRRLHKEGWLAGIDQMHMGHTTFPALVDDMRTKFMAISPWPDSHASDTPKSTLVRRWMGEYNGSSKALPVPSSWSKVKASELYRLQKIDSTFTWWVCGAELMAIKAAATGKAATVTAPMHHFMKLDRKMLDRSQKRQMERAIGKQSFDFTELDTDEVMSQGYAEAFETMSCAE